jgi:hypothetical protein
VRTSHDIAGVGTGSGSQFGNQNGDSSASVGDLTPTGLVWFETSVFTQPAAGTFGNQPRHNLRNPPFWAADASLRKTPYTLQYNIGVQRQLGWNSMLDVNLIYTRSIHEFMQDADIANFFPGNGPPRVLGDGTLPTNFIQLVTADGYSRYRALTVKWDKRFAKRFQNMVVCPLSPQHHQYRRARAGRGRAGEP